MHFPEIVACRHLIFIHSWGMVSIAVLRCLHFILFHLLLWEFSRGLEYSGSGSYGQSAAEGLLAIDPSLSNGFILIFYYNYFYCYFYLLFVYFLSFALTSISLLEGRGQGIIVFQCSF